MNLLMIKQLVASIVISLLLLSCSKSDKTREIDVLTVAVLPDQTETVLKKKYQPLMDYISGYSGLKIRLLVPSSYQQLLQWFYDKKTDMALFGGVTYVKAHIQAGAVPLVMRDVDGQFRSVALVPAASPVSSIEEMQGAALAFGSRLSTSGHLMPRYFLQQKDIIAEDFFSRVEYSGAHDTTAEWVRDGNVDVGITNSGVVSDMFADGRLSANEVKVIWQTPPFSDYVWAVQPDISKQQRNRIRSAFLTLHSSNKHRELLNNLGANYYIPVSHTGFMKLEAIVLQMDKARGRHE